MAEAARRRGGGRELAVLLAALAAIALTARLGVWQLNRAAQKTALQSALAARTAEPLLEAADLAWRSGDVEAQHFRRARVSGRWDGAHTVFLDNRQMDGKVGFFVVTPLRLDAVPAAVLVQRGFVPRNFTDRSALPAVETPAGPVRVEGIVAPSPSRLFEFSAAASGTIRQNVAPASFARETGLDLLPLVIVESATAANSHDGLARHWPAPAIDVQMHYGYAFQWFAIAATIAFLYVRHRYLRHRLRPRA